MVDFITENNIAEIEKIVEDKTKTPIEKIKELRIILSGRYREDYGLVLEINDVPNPEIRYRWIIASINKKSALVSRVIQEGIDSGVFKTKYPLELAEFVTTLSTFLFDNGLFPTSEARYISRLEAIEAVLESSLAVEEGSFDFIPKNRRKL